MAWTQDGPDSDGPELALAGEIEDCAPMWKPPARRRSASALVHAFAACLGLAAVGCAGAGQTRSADPAPNEAPLLVVFERYGCYGFCPVYWVRVADDGALLYEGAHFVAEVGRRRGQLSGGQIDALRGAFAEAGFFALEDSYDRPRYRDLPRIVTTYRDGAREKTVVHHLGDIRAPAALLELEESIDRILGTELWVGSEEERDRLSGI